MEEGLLLREYPDSWVVIIEGREIFMCERSALSDEEFDILKRVACGEAENYDIVLRGANGKILHRFMPATRETLALVEWPISGLFIIKKRVMQ